MKLTTYIKCTRVLINDYTRSKIPLMEVPLHVKGQTNSGSLMLLFNFSCNCDE